MAALSIKTANCYYNGIDGNNSHYHLCRRFEDITALNCSKSTIKSGQYHFFYRDGKIVVYYNCNNKKAIAMFKNHFPLKRVKKWFYAMGLTKKSQNTLLLQLAIYRKSIELGFTAY